MGSNAPAPPPPVHLADGLGSTMAVVDSSGNSQKSYQYDVYGEVTGGTGSLANEFDFAGQQTDGTGLQYLRARYYDPETGTFLSRDPLAKHAGWQSNHFGFGGGNPVSFSDPSGLAPVDSDGCHVNETNCAESQPAYMGCTWQTYDTHCDIEAGIIPKGFDPYSGGRAWLREYSGAPDGVEYCQVWGAYTYTTSDCQRITGKGKGEGNTPFSEEIIAGCQADPALCTLAIGARAATYLLTGTSAGATAVVCAESAGGTCFLMGLAGFFKGAVFKFLNKGIENELRARGREELERRKQQ